MNLCYCENYFLFLKLGEDAVEEHLNLQDLLDKKRNIEVKDPKKYLRNFFESEGNIIFEDARSTLFMKF